jgi:hypothetical protein
LKLLPLHSETLVSALSKEEVLGHLIRVTRAVNFLDSRSQQDPKIKFHGIVGQEGFRISRAIKKGETFLPLITGEVESTPRGCILFIRYRLFPGAVFFLGFWSIILLAFSAFYVGVNQNIGYGSLCLLLAVINYSLGVFFFHRQVKVSREVFLNLINFEMKRKD